MIFVIIKTWLRVATKNQGRNNFPQFDDDKYVFELYILTL